jgi:glycosyltransferase involved in cell wall biosynthesis
LKYADAIYCVSHGAHQNLISYYPTVKADVIYTGVDTDFFRPALVRRRPNQLPTVLYFGRLEGWKGVTHLVHAFKALNDVSFRGRIVGEGPDAAKVQALIDELQLRAKVSLEPSLRTREGVRDLIAEADVVAFTAVAEETMSNAMLEAMAMARPIVATRIGCFAEVLEQGRTAMLIEPRDTTQLAAAIRILVQSPAMRENLGSAARQRAVDQFDADASFRRVEQLFSDLCVPGLVESQAGGK